MGLIKSVIDNQLADLGRLEPDIVGFDQIELMVEGFSLTDIAAATGISVETIQRLAKEFASAERRFVTAVPGFRWLSLEGFASG